MYNTPAFSSTMSYEAWRGCWLSKSYEVRENDVTVTAGVVECKNEDYAIDQTIAEMIRTMGDVALSALAARDHIDEILVAGFAVNYATNKGKYVKLNVSFEDGSSDIVVSHNVVYFMSE